jgi:NAD(P)H-hydrate epimerase
MAMLEVVSIDQMRALERAADALGLPGPALMENAGRAVADVIRERHPVERAKHVCVVVGPGNNGGDGLVVARHLHDEGRDVVVYLVARSVTEDAKIQLLEQRGVRSWRASDDPGFRVLDAELGNSDLVVDALLGAAHLRPLTPPIADVADRVNRRGGPALVVAVDVPSGTDADSGAADAHSIQANLTITLGRPKRGLFLADAARLAGEIAVTEIGIPLAATAGSSTHYADPMTVAELLPERPRVSHKGSYGRVLIVAGSRLYTGAPVLAARGAERIGAGLVTLACPASIRDSLAVHTVETTFLPLPDAGRGELTSEAIESIKSALPTYDAVLVGPGIGRSTATDAFLQAFLGEVRRAHRPCVIDADALTLLAARERWWEVLPDETILTPHPGEMSRLAGPNESCDRIEWARSSAVAWKHTLVLKGAYSIVARQDGQAVVLPFANPTLATAGTGDVLAGAILGLIGQKCAPPAAALAGGFVHAVAGAILSQDVGASGGLAGELADALPRATRLVRESRQRSLSGGMTGW